MEHLDSVLSYHTQGPGFYSQHQRKTTLAPHACNSSILEAGEQEFKVILWPHSELKASQATLDPLLERKGGR